MPNTDLQDTQELSVDEIQDATKEESLDVPEFANHTSKNRTGSGHVHPKKVTIRTEDEAPRRDRPQRHVDHDSEDRDPEHSRKIIIAAVVIAVLIAIFLLVLAFGGRGNSKETAATPSASATSEPSSTPSSSPSASPTVSPETSEKPEQSLSGFYLDAADSAVTAKLNELYGANGYVKPSARDYKISGNMDNPVISFTVTADVDGTNYDIPVTFNLKIDSQQNSYTVSDYTADQENAVESKLQTELSGDSASVKKKKSDKNKKKKSGSVDTSDMEQAGSYPVNASTGISAEVTVDNDGTVMVVAVGENGKKTEIGTVEGPGTETVQADVTAGKYDLVFYISEGTGASWTFTAQ